MNKVMLNTMHTLCTNETLYFTGSTNHNVWEGTSIQLLLCFRYYHW